MQTVKTPTKIRRNAPCPCGSGRKYKKCCGKIEGETIMEGKITTPHLKNEFREELAKKDIIGEVQDPYAGIPVDELVIRDQAVLLKELSFRKEAIEADNTHFKTAIEKAKDLRMELLAMPKSPYRELVLKDINEQIKALTEKAATQRLPISLNLTLLALKELFAEDEDVPALADNDGPSMVPRGEEIVTVEPGDAKAEDELTIPDEQPGEGVDDDDNPEEVI